MLEVDIVCIKLLEVEWTISRQNANISSIVVSGSIPGVSGSILEISQQSDRSTPLPSPSLINSITHSKTTHVL